MKPIHRSTRRSALRSQPLFWTVLAGSALAVPFVLQPRVAFAQANAPQQANLPFLHPLFSDNAVLQRDKVIPVWGWTTPSTTVSVKVDGKETTAKADASGRWMAHIGPYAAGGPHTLRVSSLGQAEVVRQNILFGDVWICSGQSNMEMGIKQVNNANDEISKANYPQIRLFTVPKKTAATPQSTIDSQWLVCNPQNLANSGTWDGFSATAYFFGRKLNQELNIPIGLLLTSWGGTIAEAWTSESALATMPDFVPQIDTFKKSINNQGMTYEAQMQAWWDANDPGTKGNWASTTAPDADWKTLNVPAWWNDAGEGLSEFDGVAWYRREVDVPADWAGKDLTLKVGLIDDEDTTYWNGAPVGSTTGWGTPRAYKIPGAQVKAGRNVIAVRMIDQQGNGGMAGNPDQLRLELNGNTSLPLTGAWKFKASTPKDKFTPPPPRFDPDNANVVTVLYNGMVAPLVPFGVKGAIWYQGESNAERAEQYGRLLPTMIGDWRKRFETPMPFYIVQLAGYMAPDQTPRNDDWPRLRAAQAKTAATVGHSGIAVATDIGDQGDIHPKDKQDVGLRLALNALAKDYGKPVEYSGPTVKSVTKDGANLVLTFSHADGGLTLKGTADRVFAVAGADNNWFWATARVDGNRVILNSPVVTAPVAARFAWSNLPQAALYNGAGLPAAPFDTTSK